MSELHDDPSAGATPPLVGTRRHFLRRAAFVGLAGTTAMLIPAVAGAEEKKDEGRDGKKPSPTPTATPAATPGSTPVATSTSTPPPAPRGRGDDDENTLDGEELHGQAPGGNRGHHPHLPPRARARKYIRIDHANTGRGQTLLTSPDPDATFVASNPVGAGLLGESDGPAGSGAAGVVGTASQAPGVHGVSTSGPGVKASSTTGSAILAESGAGAIVALAGSGTAVIGQSVSLAGVHGRSGPSTGVIGESRTGAGVHGLAGSGAIPPGGDPGAPPPAPPPDPGGGAAIVGVLGQSEEGRGVHGISKFATGVIGQSQTFIGVHGLSVDNSGVVGQSEHARGVHGLSRGTGVEGSGDAFGVVGGSPAGIAVAGFAASGTGLLGRSESGAALRVQGPIVASSSGLGYVPPGESQGSVPVPWVHNEANSFVVATLQGTDASIWVASAKISGGMLTAYLTGPTGGPGALFAYLVLENFPESG